MRILLLLIPFLLGCEKPDYCATCFEKNSGYVKKYHGTEKDVDIFIIELYDRPNQEWYCTKSLK